MTLGRRTVKRKWLIACECSAVVRDALRALGHDAWSCDLKPCERDPRWHIQDDVLKHLDDGWDGMIAHPDCTYLTVANNGPMANGCKLYTAAEARRRRNDGVLFFMEMVKAFHAIPHVAIENPVGVMSTLYRKPDQIIQPWHFGDDASKKTCLWLLGLPKLVDNGTRLPGDDKTRRANQTPNGQNKLGPSDTRKADRARTYPGIAAAMASQWGDLDFKEPPCP